MKMQAAARTWGKQQGSERHRKHERCQERCCSGATLKLTSWSDHSTIRYHCATAANS